MRRRYNSQRHLGGTAIKTILTALLLAGVIMFVLRLMRLPFAVWFWRRAQWVAWIYIAVVVLSAIRLLLFS